MANRYGYFPSVIHTIGPNGRTIPVDSTNPLEISGSVSVDSNLVSPGNSTTSLLGSGATFTGVGEDILNYTSITVSLSSDVDSATLGVVFQFSDDNTTWMDLDTYTYFANGTKTYTVQRVKRYFRLVYINGSSGQSSFIVSVIYNATAGVASSHRIGDTISNEDDAQLTKAVLSGERPTGDQVNIGATAEGALNTSVVTPTGSLPVSQLTTLHDGKTLNRLFPEINEVQGTGTGTFQTNKYDMAVTAGQWLVKQSKRFYPYFSGKPQKVELTFDNFAPEADVVKRVGYFSSNTVSPFETDYDGFYLESGNGTISFEIIRNGVSIQSVDITNWTGYDVLSNYQTLSEWDNFTVIEFNFLWLGGAYIELRVFTDSGFTTVHDYIYAGTAQDVFIQSPNQPVRYEIRSTTGTGNFRYICNQVATAGSIDESAISRSVNTGSSATSLPTIGTSYALLGIRKNASNRENPIRISNADVFVESNDRILWELQINPTIPTPLVYSSVTNSSLQFATGTSANTVTPATGTVVASGYLTQRSNIEASIFVNNYLAWLSGQLDGTQDEYVLTVTPITANINCLASMVTLEG